MINALYDGVYGEHACVCLHMCTAVCLVFDMAAHLRNQLYTVFTFYRRGHCKTKSKVSHYEISAGVYIHTRVDTRRTAMNKFIAYVLLTFLHDLCSRLY